MQTATSETESKSLDLSICVHHYTLRAPCPKGQGILHHLSKSAHQTRAAQTDKAARDSNESFIALPGAPHAGPGPPINLAVPPVGGGYMVKHSNTRPSFRRQKGVEANRISPHQRPFKAVQESRCQRQKGLSREQDVDSCWPINGPSTKGAVQRNIVKVTGKVNSRI